jgi:glycosyltransferase involved in cell wall biosynthesis
VLTVLMATHNGSDTLPDVLAAYRRLEPPPGGWNVVVVDNGSLDATKPVIRDFESQLPLTYVFESTLGKNAALNTGLRHATGDLVVLTDDDILPRPDWLQRLRGAADAAPDFAIFGGRIVPRWPSAPPDWILRLVPLSPTFAASPPLDSGPVEVRRVYGGNMAVRRNVFDLGYAFDTTIGPCGAHYAQGSELELTRRLERAQFKAWYCAEAVVEHIILPHQLTERWILQRARRYGRGYYRLAPRKSVPLVIPLVNIPLRLSLSLARQALRVLHAYMRHDDEALFKARWTWSFRVGWFEEARCLHRPRPPAATVGPTGDSTGQM